MLFQVYGDGAWIKWLGMFAVLVGLILVNEISRRTKTGGILTLFVFPLALTVYLVTINIMNATGAYDALPAVAQQTITEMNSWFHYAKLYAALAGCIGFLFIKYQWGIGKKHWFKCFPFIIVAINILIAVVSDSESAIRGFSAGGMAGGYWLSSEGVWVYGGWHNIFNALAGIINIMGMTGWWSVYSSKDKHRQDMIWPDMTWCYIIAYDIWNFAYTYNCLPTHSWFCGIALLFAPTIAALIWNKGGWIQNRANTLFFWCAFAQVVPFFQNHSIFSTLPVLYPTQATISDVQLITFTGAEELPAVLANNPANWYAMLVVSVLAFVANAALLGVIVARSQTLKRNPYTQDIFLGTGYYQKAIARADEEQVAIATENK